MEEGGIVPVNPFKLRKCWNAGRLNRNNGYDWWKNLPR